jgi:hypothetical protein
MRDFDNSTAVAHDGADLLSDLEKSIAKRRVAAAAPAPRAEPERLPAKVYGVMAVTTVLTFATLTTGYQLLFPPHQLFA